MREKIAKLENKRIDTESSIQALEQYDRRNNIEISGIPDSVQNDQLEDTVSVIFNSMGININENDIEDCHRIGKSKPKKTIVRFTNRKFCKKAMKNKSKLKDKDTTEFGNHFADKPAIYISDNLSPSYSETMFYCRKLKRAGRIHNNYYVNGKIFILRTPGENPKRITHKKDLKILYPDFVFGDEELDDDDWNDDFLENGFTD